MFTSLSEASRALHGITVDLAKSKTVGERMKKLDVAFGIVADHLANKPAAGMMDIQAVREGRCAFPPCGKEITLFRDALSLKEFAVSGMCQECQDKVFGI
jgi:hypothetical protein